MIRQIDAVVVHLIGVRKGEPWMVAEPEGMARDVAADQRSAFDVERVDMFVGFEPVLNEGAVGEGRQNLGIPRLGEEVRQRLAVKVEIDTAAFDDLIELPELRPTEECLEVGGAQVIAGMVEGVEVLELIDPVLFRQRLRSARDWRSSGLRSRLQPCERRESISWCRSGSSVTTMPPSIVEM